MEKIDFKNLPDKTTPINAANLNKMQDNTEKAIGEKLDKTSKATSTEAIAGTNNTKYTTPCSVKSAIDKALEGYTPSGGGSGGDTLPIGSIVAFSSDTIPNGWLLCDGSVVSRTTYSELFNAIGLNYVEDGVEWLDEERFPLPNAKGRTLVGKDSTDTDFNTLGKTGGEKTHTLTVSELPSHSHVINSFRQYETGASTDSSKLGRTTVGADGGNSTIATGETGRSQAHNNLQPYIVENYIIKAKQTASIQGEVIQENDTATTENVYSASAVDNKLAQIIQSGSNTNGSYIKYSDGTMICYGSTSLNEVSVSDYYSFCKRTNSLTITFPMEFDEVPNVTITNQGFGIFSYTINNITANNFSYYAFTYPSGSNISGSLQYVAIGKWK